MTRLRALCAAAPVLAVLLGAGAIVLAVARLEVEAGPRTDG